MTRRKGTSQPKTSPRAERASAFRWRKTWAVAALVFAALVAVAVEVWPFGRSHSQSIANPDAPLVSFFRPEVLYWRDEIEGWAREHHVNPNVIAIVIQIESCGNPNVISSAGALGLMQVMPFHFQNGENMLNPDTNVARGMSVFYECLTQFAGWDLGKALACYNGGPSVTQRDRSTWAAETQYYYRWATGLWADVQNGVESSDTLKDWLAAGGERLCVQAGRSQSAGVAG